MIPFWTLNTLPTNSSTRVYTEPTLKKSQSTVAASSLVTFESSSSLNAIVLVSTLVSVIVVYFNFNIVPCCHILSH